MNNKNNDILKALETGIKKGKRTRRAAMALNINLLALAFVFIAFSISVNVSGVLADSLKDVPVIGKIVQFVRIGGGFEDAAEHGYFSEGETIYEDDTYKVSVEGYYLSAKNLNIVLILEGELDDNLVCNTENVKVFDTDMNLISGYFLTYGPFREIDGNHINDITLTQSDTVFPDEIIVRFDIETFPIEVEAMPGETSIVHPEPVSLLSGLEVSLTKQVDFDNIEIPMDYTMESNGIRFNFSNLIIRPTTMDLSFTLESDSMKFLGFTNIYFKNDDTVYLPLSNGVISSGDNEVGYTYYFNTNFFHPDKPLTLVIDGIYALPEDESTVTIDTETGKVVESFDENIIFNGITYSDDIFILSFTYNDDRQFNFSKYNDNYFTKREIAYHNDKSIHTLIGERQLISDANTIVLTYNLRSDPLPCHKEIPIIP